ncbi:WxL domain-containing protein [Levilactobacillus suantsaii]|uniref:WxL domain-containing protein n=2 Tax=Levilactobacillus suantsaii TaxID=2292255 RepID=A0A4Q0VJI7_9LACO|nr:hypothetical protein [Levilactobacillus suantsaii]RXI79544.1 hypothetical protein DXH47_02130 [Levilactobacillus suantsaii]
MRWLKTRMHKIGLLFVVVTLSFCLGVSGPLPSQASIQEQRIKQKKSLWPNFFNLSSMLQFIDNMIDELLKNRSPKKFESDKKIISNLLGSLPGNKSIAKKVQQAKDSQDSQDLQNIVKNFETEKESISDKSSSAIRLTMSPSSFEFQPIMLKAHMMPSQITPPAPTLTVFNPTSQDWHVNVKLGTFQGPHAVPTGVALNLHTTDKSNRALSNLTVIPGLRLVPNDEAHELLSASKQTDTGSATIDFDGSTLQWPSDSYAGTYTANLTYTLTVGPEK